MKRDGFNFKTVEWVDGKPTTPVARVPSKKSPDSLELS
jgi:hypothetical protein